jgi:hypothetical protein
VEKLIDYALSDYMLSVCEEGIVISRGKKVWFFSYKYLDGMENVEEFLEEMGW